MHRAPRWSVASFAAALLCASALVTTVRPLPAQSPLAPGARVRLTGAGASGLYQLVSASPDTLVVRGDATAAPQVVPLDRISRLEVSQGRRSVGSGLRRGALIGAGAGALLGLVSGFAQGDDPENTGAWFVFTAEQKAAGSGVILGLVGGVAGGITGAIVRPERWQRVEGAPRVSVVNPPVGRGLGVRVAGAF